MARLLLVRHGQANFYGENYDELSPLGAEQARRLGAWLSSHAVQPTRVFRGSLQRHRQTVEGLQAGGLSLPDVQEDPGFNEYQFQRVLKAYLQIYPDCVVHREATQNNLAAAWIAVLREALAAWSRHELDGFDVEPFADFTGRIGQAFEQSIAGAARDEVVLVVTSGGVISTVLQRVLELAWHRAIEFNVVLKNASLTELRLGKTSVLLDAFNTLPHLAAPADQGMHTLV